MARRVFFSFHYARDVWRVNQVRQSWITKPNRQIAGFIDAADFEKIRQKGQTAVERWIDKQLLSTSVTVVLIGAQTYQRRYVKYEIRESVRRGNGLIGIYIHKLRNNAGLPDKRGANPLDKMFFTERGRKVYLSQYFDTHDWVLDDGYNNLGDWVEQAAIDAGR